MSAAATGVSAHYQNVDNNMTRTGYPINPGPPDTYLHDFIVGNLNYLDKKPLTVSEIPEVTIAKHDSMALSDYFSEDYGEYGQYVNVDSKGNLKRVPIEEFEKLYFQRHPDVKAESDKAIAEFNKKNAESAQPSTPLLYPSAIMGSTNLLNSTFSTIPYIKENTEKILQIDNIMSDYYFSLFSSMDSNITAILGNTNSIMGNPLDYVANSNITDMPTSSDSSMKNSISTDTPKDDLSNSLIINNSLTDYFTYKGFDSSIKGISGKLDIMHNELLSIIGDDGFLNPYFQSKNFPTAYLNNQQGQSTTNSALSYNYSGGSAIDIVQNETSINPLLNSNVSLRTISSDLTQITNNCTEILNLQTAESLSDFATLFIDGIKIDSIQGLKNEIKELTSSIQSLLLKPPQLVSYPSVYVNEDGGTFTKSQIAEIAKLALKAVEDFLSYEITTGV